MVFEILEQEGKALVAGLHHVAFLCVRARVHDVFWTKILGLRRVKQTVVYDCPDSYLLYYGNETGAPGTIISSLILPEYVFAKTYRGFAAGQGVRMRRGEEERSSGRENKRSSGKNAARYGKKLRRVGEHKIVLAVRAGALPFWQKRLQSFGIEYGLKTVFGQTHVFFAGPCGEQLELTEIANEKRRGWAAVIAPDKAICGLHSLSLAVRDKQAAADLLAFLGYCQEREEGNSMRFILPHGNGANILDIEQGKQADPAEYASNINLKQSVNLKRGALTHFAFALAPGQDLVQLREILLDKGYKIGGLVNNIYFSSFYLRAPKGGSIVEFATNSPGFEKDEDKALLGTSLQLPKSHEHLRQFIMSHLESLIA